MRNLDRNIIIGLIITISFYTQAEGAVLGGIGTGKIDIDPQGKLTGITTQHNPNQPISDPEGCFAAIAVDAGSQPVIKKLYTDKQQPNTIQNIQVQASYPYADVTYTDTDFPVKVSLQAYSPLIPENINDSCYPAVVFRYTVHNPTDKEIKVTMAMTWRNWAGHSATAKDILDVTGQLRNTMLRRRNLTGVLFEQKNTQPAGMAQNGVGETILAYQAAGKELVSVLPSWQPETDPAPFMAFMEKPESAGKPKDALLDFSQSNSSRPAASVAAKQSIAPGKDAQFTFILTWYFPHQIARDEKDYGVYYTTQWNSADGVLDTVDKRKASLEEQMQSWRSPYQHASIPDWLTQQMFNELARLASHGVFLQDGRFALLSNDAENPGNLGSPEERLVDADWLLVCYPELLLSELHLYRDTQLAEGEVPTAVGNLDQTIGNGNVPGGFVGRVDSSAAFVMLVYQYSLWTGDNTFLKDMITHTRYAIHWLMNHDSNNDSIPDGPSLCPWGKEGITSLFSGSLTLAAYRIGEELEQQFKDQEFQSWCQRYRTSEQRNLGSQLWNGYTYNPYFDATRPLSQESAQMIPGQLPGEAFAAALNWNPLLPADRLHRMAQTFADAPSSENTDAQSSLALMGRYGFAQAFTAPLLLRSGYAQAAFAQMQAWNPPGTPSRGAWAFFHALCGLSLDMQRHCLIVGPNLPFQSEELSCPLETPLYEGQLHYTRSALTGQQTCRLELQRIPRGKDFALQQIALAIPRTLNANDQFLQVFHNEELLAGQDFSRESLRVFGFPPGMRFKEGDTLTLFLSPKDGPRLAVDVQSREIRNLGCKCRIEATGFSIPGVSFYIRNQVSERQMIALEFLNPSTNQEYKVFINGQERPYPVPSMEPVPVMLPLSPINTSEIAQLQILARACQQAALKLAAIPNKEPLKKQLWDLQEEVNRLMDMDAVQRGVRVDVIPTSALDQITLPKPENPDGSMRDALNQLTEKSNQYIQAIQSQSGDPVLASELMGSFVPAELLVTTHEIVSATGDFNLNLQIVNPTKALLKGQVTLQMPEGWHATTDNDVEFDDRENTQEEHDLHFLVQTPNDLVQKRYAMDTHFSGIWNEFPFRKTQTVYVGHDFIRRWLITGPFPNERGEGFGKVLPPEMNIQTKEQYDGLGKKVGWQEFEFPNGYVDLDSVLSPNDNTMAYAYTSIYSPREQPVQFRVGCNGDLKIFMNYQEIYSKRNVGKPKPGGEVITHRLFEGWNHIVVKLCEQSGPWGFYFEVYDLQGRPIDGIQFALDKADRSDAQ